MSGANKNTKDEDIDCGCYAKSHTKKACPPIRNVTHPLRYYEFTQDEIRVLEECDRESFYRRCLPFSTLFATITYAAIKFDKLRRSPHFGAIPKVLVAALIGHAYGRVSFTSQCEKKLLELPADSHLGNVMRKYNEEHNPSDPKKKK